MRESFIAIKFTQVQNVIFLKRLGNLIPHMKIEIINPWTHKLTNIIYKKPSKKIEGLSYYVESTQAGSVNGG